MGKLNFKELDTYLNSSYQELQLKEKKKKKVKKVKKDKR